MSGSPYSAIQLAPASSLAVAAHVDQRDGAEQGAEALGIARQHVGDQQAAIGAAFGGDAARPRHAAAHQVGGDSGEIVVAQPLAGTAAGFVPARAELAAASDIAMTLVPPRSSHSLPAAML